MDNKKIIGQRINSALAKKDLKQKDLAQHLGVTDNTVSYFCSGNRTPNTSQIIEIAKFLEVSTDYLLGLAQEPTTDKDFNYVCEYTGLSSEAVIALIDMREHRETRAFSDLLSCLLSHPNFMYLLGLLEGYIVPHKETISESFAMSRAVINYKDLCMFAVSNDLKNILDNIAPEFLKKYLTTDDRMEIFSENKEKEYQDKISKKE